MIDLFINLVRLTELRTVYGAMFVYTGTVERKREKSRSPHGVWWRGGGGGVVVGVSNWFDWIGYAVDEPLTAKVVATLPTVQTVLSRLISSLP